MSRRTKDQRREDYLDAGAAIIADGPADAGLAVAHVKMVDVAERAGVTKGALYHLWPSQEAYWNDLLVHLLDEHQLTSAEQVQALAERIPADDSGADQLRQFVTALFDTRKADPAFYVRLALFSYLDDPGVRERLDSDFRSSLQEAAPLLRAAIADMGRRPIVGVDVDDITVAVGALLDGMCMQYRIDTDRNPALMVDNDDAETGVAEQSLFAAAAEALLIAYTEPLESPPGNPDDGWR